MSTVAAANHSALRVVVATSIDHALAARLADATVAAGGEATQRLTQAERDERC